MTSLEPGAYRDHIVSESRRFRAALSMCDPDARVPGCPDWTVADLLHHLTGVQEFWAGILTRRPRGPEGREERPRAATYDEMLTAFDAATAGLAAALAEADPSDEAWTWSADHSVRFIVRRQAHEALIHRLDAEQAAGAVTPMDTALAADGVAEFLDVMLGACPPWGTFTPEDQLVRVDLTDAQASVWVRLGRFTGTDPSDQQSYDEEDIHVVADPGSEPDVVLAGAAQDLDCWLWRRGDDSRIRVSGRSDVHDRFRRSVDQPIG